mmetsp:Transcript_34233/g.88450  ORF Transcript_34233/g.88450 Transcript_34233/m.88450 type:complete len:92 (-) Transcript_34233:2513-2788(-)
MVRCARSTIYMRASMRKACAMCIGRVPEMLLCNVQVKRATKVKRETTCVRIRMCELIVEAEREGEGSKYKQKINYARPFFGPAVLRFLASA